MQGAGGMPHIDVRPARSGEKLQTLDGQWRELSPDNLIIADSRGPIAIAGVMGGADTEVSPATTNILLESANFDFVSVRRTMKAFNLPSEASDRFSRGIHPEIVRPAPARAADVIGRYGQAIVSRGLMDCYPSPLPMKSVNLDVREVRRILGIEISSEEILRTLRALEFETKETEPGQFRAVAPPHRLDIHQSADFMEEFARVH